MEKIKLRIYFFFLIYLLFNSNINCQSCSGCKISGNLCVHIDESRESCPSNCMLDLVNNICVPCTGVGRGGYYIINESGCSSATSCTKYIYNTFQCVDDCPSSHSYNLGKYCYPSCSGNMQEKIGATNQCECAYKNYTDANGQIQCLGSGVTCNPEHRYYKSQQCSTTPLTNYLKLEERDKGLSIIFECLDFCDTSYFYEEGGKNYCVDSCPKDKFVYYSIVGNPAKKCVSECPPTHPYLKDTYECVDIDSCTLVDGDKCLTTSNACLHISGSKVCVPSCPETHPYKDPDNNICYQTCSFINTNNECVSSTDCFYTEDSAAEVNKICYSSCKYSPKPFTIAGTNQCVTACPSDHPYRFENEYTCYDSCSSIPYLQNIGDKYYSIINTCHCYLYGIDGDGKYYCFTNDEECTKSPYNFKYKRGNQCVKECTSFIYEVPNNPSGKKLDECYDSVDECIDKKYYYYNTKDRRCYVSLPAGANSNEIDVATRLPKEDEGRNTYTYGCGSLLFPKKTTKGICKKECDKDEYFKPSNPNECLSKCNVDGSDTTTYYIGYNNECLTSCPDYYIEISGKKKCVEHCKDYGKYYFLSDRKCYDSCVKNSKIYFYNIDDNKCVETCMNNVGSNKYAYAITDAPQPCLTKPEGKYYDINNIILLDKCKLISKDDPQKCVEHCNGMKVYHKRCVSECPDKYGPYVHELREGSTNIYIDKCVLQCPTGKTKIIAYRNECVNKCPDNYIEDKYERCFYANCPKGLKYNPSSLKCEDCSPYEKKKIVINGVTRDIYICKSSCNTELKYIKDINDQECVEHCPSENNYIGGDYICRTHCNGNHSYFVEKYSGTDFYQCVKHCPTERDYFYIVEYKGNDRVVKEECVLNCPDTFPFGVDNKYECLQACPTDKPYYYKSKKNNGDKYYACTSKFKCGYGTYSNEKYYCEDDCYNANGIKSKNKLYVKDNLCIEEEECPAGYKKQRENYGSNDIIICKPECDPNEYIKGDECLPRCPEDLNYIGNGNKCKSSCRDEGQATLYYRFEYVTASNYQIYKCVNECPYDFIYSSNDNLCLDSCELPHRYLSKKENFCYINCFSQSGNTKFNLTVTVGTNTITRCLSECNDPEYPEYKYYYKNVKVCLKKCFNDDYVNEITNECIRDCSLLGGNYYYYDTGETSSQVPTKFCVKKCPPSKNFIRGKTCETSCDTSSDEKFYIKEYKHGEADLQRKCSSDCTTGYPYYYDDGKYECLEACQTGHYFVPKLNPNKNATLCLSSCNYNSPTYKYKIENETSKTCYKECPGERPYHKDITKSDENDNKCYSECPPDAPFHEKVEDKTRFICKTLDNCNYNYVNYVTKECLASEETCPDGSKLSEYKGKKVCLNDCMEPYGKYPTEYNTCVNDCASTTNSLVKDLHLKKDPQNPKCICENLYYKTNDNKTICFENSIGKECKDMAHHKINLYGTKECILSCDGIGVLSPLEDICFNNNYDCHNYLNTKVYNKVLNENDEAKKKCDCVEKYYFKDNGEKICLAEGEICPNGYDQKYIPEKKQCLKNGSSCPTLFSRLFLDKYCLRLCPANSHESSNICTCDTDYNYWREVSPSNLECVKDCYHIHLVSIPSENNKCVEKCEGHYSRFYNNECYLTCQDDNIKILDAIEVYVGDFDLSNYKCECKPGYSWYIGTDNKKHCVTDCYSINPPFNYTIKSTSQCVNTCPPEYYIFNNECFTSCEDEAYKKYHLNVKTVDNFQDCQCRGIWRYANSENNFKECLLEESCALPGEAKKFLFNQTQCLEKCPSGWVGFNFLCSNNCPKHTIDKKSENGEFDCTCNLNDGYWYEYQEFGNTYYVCGLEKCPKYHKSSDNKIFVRNNLIESEKKCVNSCRNEGREDNKKVYALRNICIEYCPDYTYTNKDDDACLFFDLNDTRITDLEQLKNAANVQVKELYEKSEKTGGYLFNKFNASLEIYAVDKDNSLKDISFKSNLTYIDFGACLDKLYSDKSIGKDNKLLVAKYDLLPGANINVGEQISENKNLDKYLINPVEYGLYSSNMSEELDAHVCQPYEILISYPLVFNKFDKVIDGIVQNEYRTKFQIGKDLYHMDNEIDTFNYNNTIYKNFCRGLEIDGKDLVFEDRYKYLYPNNKILCESNCTLNNTDFELGRVNCLCPYKYILDLKRIEKQTNDILNDPNFVLPTQSQSNIEALNCLFEFNLKQAIIYNDAFYFCLVGLIAQIIMLILSACLGIKNVTIDIKQLLNKINLQKNIIGKKAKTQKNSGFKKEDFIGSTNRPLNNPPRKNDVNERNNEDIDIDIDSINEEKDVNNNTSIDNNSSNNDGGNNEINLKKENKAENKTKTLDNSNGMKVEYIPPEYNFKYFKNNDKGVMKKVERSKIPFEVNPDTQYLIERREGIEYPEDYLKGPYYQDQNIIVLTDEKNIDADKIVKYIRDEKISKDLKPKKKNNDKNDKNNDKNDKNNYKNDKNNKDDDKFEKNLKKRINLFGNKKNNISITEKSSFEFKKSNPSIQKSKIDYSNETLFEELYEGNDLKLNKDEINLFSLVKREQLFLRVEYDIYMEKNHGNALTLFLAEILDKIYFVKICLFLKKVDIFSIHCSLYILCHIILLSLLCGFFTIQIIKKIWEEDNFPGLNFYLLYGLISHIIVWVVYQIFLCLLDNQDKVKDLIILKNEFQNINVDNIDIEDIDDKNDDILRKKYNDAIFEIKFKTAIFYTISLLLSLFLTVYLISFFSLYTGTKRRVLKAYYISIIEILLIKFAYGFILFLLRLLSTVYRVKLLYDIVRIFNKYFS